MSGIFIYFYENIFGKKYSYILLLKKDQLMNIKNDLIYAVFLLYKPDFFLLKLYAIHITFIWYLKC